MIACVIADGDHCQQGINAHNPIGQRSSRCPANHPTKCHNKHAQTIEKLDRTHASLTKALQIKTRERNSKWHKYVNLAILNYKSCWHSSIGREPSPVFQGRVSYKFLVFRTGIQPTDYLYQILRVPKMSWSERRLST